MEIIKLGNAKERKLNKIVFCSECNSSMKIDEKDIHLEKKAYCICPQCQADVFISLSYEEVQLIKKS